MSRPASWFPSSLETARLRLRPVEAADAPAIFEGYARDLEVTRYLTWRPHRTLSDTEAYVSACLALEPERACVYAVLSRGAGKLLGSLHARRPASHRIEVGYLLARPHWGHGLMSEAVGAVVARAMAEPGVFRIGAVCDVDNPASARVMAKAGMSFEGLRRRWMVHPNVSDEPRDCLSYARTW